MILIIREPATREQLAQLSETSGGTLVKLAVDVERRVLVGGGELHADCEAAFWKMAASSLMFGERTGILLPERWVLSLSSTFGLDSRI